MVCSIVFLRYQLLCHAIELDICRRTLRCPMLLRTPKNEIQLFYQMEFATQKLLHPSVRHSRQRKLFKIVTVEEERRREKIELKEMCRGIAQVVQVCPFVTNRKCTKCDAHAGARKSQLFELMFNCDWWQCCRCCSGDMQFSQLLIYFIVLFLWPSPRFVCFDLLSSCPFRWRTHTHTHTNVARTESLTITALHTANCICSRMQRVLENL